MKVSLKWLKDYVDLVHPPEEIARLLTMAGTEVGAIHYQGKDWHDMFVAEVKNLSPHPNADRLQLVTVSLGDREMTIVAGAFNISVGDKVPLSLPGARLVNAYSDDPPSFVVKPTKLRGVVSEGVLGSEKELGISDDHTGIMILDPEARVGAPLADELGDVIFDLEVTPNRPDLLSMIGVAREVGALTGQQLRLPDLSYEEGRPLAEEMIAIEIADPDLCHRYSASMITGVKIGPSPKWMRDRLTAAGMRPISNVVDITNYVMLEWGQPLHGFDYDKIGGHKIVVRRARPAEKITTLDGVDRYLTTDMLVIADQSVPVAIAGVMGGADSEVSETTRTILLESANFDRVANRRASRALKLPSEASRRYERGLPEELTTPASRRATKLMAELAGGTAARGIVDAYPVKQIPVSISLRGREVERILGMHFDNSKVAEILTRLGFETAPEDAGLLVSVPYYRLDVKLPADLIEEVARTEGYDSIPNTMLRGNLPESQFNESLMWEDLTRGILVGSGLTEIITYTLTSRQKMRALVPSEEDGERLETTADEILQAINSRISVLGLAPLLVVNPLSSEMECLRTTTLVSMIETLRNNLRFRDKDVMLFEIGKVYLPRKEGLPEERRIITVGTGAYKSGGDWGEKKEVSFFDLKAVAESILERFGLSEYSFLPVAHPTFRTGLTAAVVLGHNVEELARKGVTAISQDQVVGIVGELNDRVAEKFDVDGRVYLMALDLELLSKLGTRNREFKPIPRFPAVEEDIAVVVVADVPAELVRETIQRAGGVLVTSVALFDVYQGERVPAGKKSLAYHVVYQALDRTLTDQEVNSRRDQIEKTLNKELGASFRR